ncbi:MAG: hypothetical protein JWO99_94 [Candidatus Saccharibacteria bacterium]|nr:hypothetical protein [Candidatus Saccharibacteria bacterium]
MSCVQYVDYTPGEDVGFESNIAARFGFKSAGNELVRQAVAYLEEMHLFDVERVPEEGRSGSGSQGQPYPNKLDCTASLR